MARTHIGGLIAPHMTTHEPLSKQVGFLGSRWEFPKNRGTLFWGPYNRDPTIYRTIVIFGSPIFGNSQVYTCCSGPGSYACLASQAV